MSNKYTRSNKIHHYHDSSTSRMANHGIANSSSRLTPSIITDRIMENNSIHCNSGSSSSRKSSRKSLGLSTCSELDELGDPSIRNIEPLMMKKARKNNVKISNRRIQLDSSTQLKQLAFFAFFILMASVIVCSGLIREVASLNCYHCSSVDNPECDEPFTGRANFTDTDCEKHIGRPAKVCRKIVQYIEDKKVVIRSCGFIDEHEGKDRKAMCYKRSGTFAIMMESCNCYEDNCNHSASLVPSKGLLISLAFIVLVVVVACLRTNSGDQH